jgi:hypothetical protein
VDNFLGMEIFNALRNIKSLDKAIATSTIPDFVNSSYQRNTIGGICVISHTILTIQEFYYIPVFHPGRHKAKSDFQGFLQKVDAIKG